MEREDFFLLTHTAASLHPDASKGVIRMAKRWNCPYGWSWCKGDCDRCTEDRYRRERNQWEKTKSSQDHDTGLNQTDFYSGTVGQSDQKNKVHVAIDELGNVVYVRDKDGTALYDKKNHVGHHPYDLDWSRFNSL